MVCKEDICEVVIQHCLGMFLPHTVPAVIVFHPIPLIQRISLPLQPELDSCSLPIAVLPPLQNYTSERASEQGSEAEKLHNFVCQKTIHIFCQIYFWVRVTRLKANFGKVRKHQ